MYVYNGQQLLLDQAFTIGDVNYAPNWLRNSTPQERSELGINEIIFQERPDDRFYWVTSNIDGSFDATPKDLAATKTVFLSQINQTAHTILVSTDYMDFRHFNDSTYTAPAEWLSYRTAVRSYVRTIKAAINAATDIPSLITVVSGLQWPAAPNTTS